MSSANLEKKEEAGFWLRLSSFIVNKRKAINLLFILAAIYSVICINRVAINQDITSYLPATSETRVGLTKMDEEFITYGSARVMVGNISFENAEILKEKLEEIENIKAVEFDNTKDHYKGSNALFDITVRGTNDDSKAIAAMNMVEQVLKGYDAYISTAIGETEKSMASLNDDMNVILILAVFIIVVVLFISTKAFMEIPVLLITFGMAALLNKGTNCWFGEISSVTNSIAVVLQLALAIDYAIILCDRYMEEHETLEPVEAVKVALSKAIPEISSSSLTTVSGMAAMMFMQFRLGFDMGIVLVKAILFSLISVFFLMPGVILIFSKGIDKTMHKNFVPKISIVGKVASFTRYIVPPLFLILIGYALYTSGNCTYLYDVDSVQSATKSEAKIAQEKIDEIFGSTNQLVVMVPVGDYDKEAKLISMLEKLDCVKSVTGLANQEVNDEYMVTSKLTPRQFSELTDLDIEVVRVLYMAYAYSVEQYGPVVTGIDDYSVPIIDMFLFLYDQYQEGYVKISSEMDATLTELYDKLNDGRVQLKGENYSRLVLNFAMPVEGEETYEEMEEIRVVAESLYGAGTVLLVGNSTSAHDLASSFAKDNIIISVLTALFVLIILLFTFQSVGLPVLLVLTIQGSIWINFTVPVWENQGVYFIAYLIVSAIQMGATIDYAIVISSRYLALKSTMSLKDAITETLNQAFPTIFTSGTILTCAGFLIGRICSDATVAAIGVALGRGTLISIILVLFVLPQILLLGDLIIEKTSLNVKFGGASKNMIGRIVVNGYVRGEFIGRIDGEVKGILEGSINGAIDTKKEGQFVHEEELPTEEEPMETISAEDILTEKSAKQNAGKMKHPGAGALAVLVLAGMLMAFNPLYSYADEIAVSTEQTIGKTTEDTTEQTTEQAGEQNGEKTEAATDGDDKTDITSDSDEGLSGDENYLTDEFGNPVDENGEPAIVIEEEVVEISNREEFLDFAKNCIYDAYSIGVIFNLTCDIDLTDAEFYGIPYFNGTFDGNGHSITGINLQPNGSDYGFFRYVGSFGLVRNLTVSGTVTAGGTGKNIGGIAGTNRGIISGCVFTGSVTGKENVGGIVGENDKDAYVTECENYGLVLATDNTGGVVGYNYGTILLSKNYGSINVEELEPSMDVAGVDIGSLNVAQNTYACNSEGGIAGFSNGLISGCTNEGIVGYEHSGYNAGGIVGAQNGIVLDSENKGTVLGRKDVGGIVGQGQPFVQSDYLNDFVDTAQKQIDELNSTLTGINSTIKTTSNKTAKYADRINSTTAAQTKKLSKDIYDYTAATEREYPETKDYTNNINNAMDNINRIQQEGNMSAEAAAVMQKNLNTIESNLAEIKKITGDSNSTTDEKLNKVSNDLKKNSQYDDTTKMIKTINKGVNNVSKGMDAAIEEMNNIRNTVSDATSVISGAQEYIQDISSIETAATMNGVISGCTNSGEVRGDINVGGIVGSTNVEIESDPEFDMDFSTELSLVIRSTVNSVIINCINTGKITVKKNNAAGICGLESLGLIYNCENYGNVVGEDADYIGGIAGSSDTTVQSSYSLCTLTGTDYVGGIVGYGYGISECISIPAIVSYGEAKGAIAGRVGENAQLVENFFFCEKHGGIDDISYMGQADPLSYEQIMEKTVPEGFNRVQVMFLLDGKTISTMFIPYGSSLSESDYPKVPEQRDFYIVWHGSADTVNVTENLVMEVEYVPWTTTVLGSELSESGRNLFMVVGEFYAGTSIEMEEYEGVVVKSALKELAYAYKWKLTNTGNLYTSKVEGRFLIPENCDSAELYICENGMWNKVPTTIDGSYMVSVVKDGDVFAVVGVHVPKTSVRQIAYTIAAIAIGAAALSLVLIIIYTGVAHIKKRNKAGVRKAEDEKAKDKKEEKAKKQKNKKRK